MGVHYQSRSFRIAQWKTKIDGAVITIVTLLRSGENWAHRGGLTAPLEGITAKTAANDTLSEPVYA